MRGGFTPLTVTKSVGVYVRNSERQNSEEKGVYMFIRRLGQNGRQRCSSGHYCPQILEMVDGDFAVVGPLITEEAAKAMPPGPGVGPMEGVVRIPRAVMIAARADIPVAV